MRCIDPCLLGPTPGPFREGFEGLNTIGNDDTLELTMRKALNPQKVWVKKYISVLLGLSEKTAQDKWAFFGYDPILVRKYMVSQGYRVPRPAITEKRDIGLIRLVDDPPWNAKAKRGKYQRKN